MSGIRIRAPLPDDIAPLTIVSNLPGVRAGTLRFPHTSEDFIRKRLLESPPNTQSLVAAFDGEPVGQGTLMRRMGRQAHVGDVFLFVHDDYWGRGIGRALFGALIDLADNWYGLTRLQLEVNVDNPRAIDLYERAGFRREGTLRASVIRDGALVDCLVMGRVIEPPRRLASDDTGSTAPPAGP